MIIEIRATGFVNKGAELMLRAILDKLGSAYPDALFTLAPSHQGGANPFRELVDAGLYPKAWLHYMGVQWGFLAGLAPRKLREMYGVILDREVDVVIDAAGFSYSDQSGEQSSRELAQSARRWRRRGTKVILMPQAFGPYTGRRIRSAMRRAVDNIDLVMPREATSYQYLTNVCGDRANIRQYPDFTNLLPGVRPNYFDDNQHRVCLVPNFRMIDKTRGRQSAEYLPFMVRCAQQLADKGAKPFILVHEGADDMWLAQKISERSGGIPILREGDPIKIKGILGASQASIGSRFHGLVSALSQGVPALGTGWSHKYTELFNDYNYPEGLVSVEDSNQQLAAKIDLLVDESANRERSTALLEESAHLRVLSENMWADVFSVIDEKL